MGSPSLPEVDGVSVMAARSFTAAAGLHPRSQNPARHQPGVAGRFRISRTRPTKEGSPQYDAHVGTALGLLLYRPARGPAYPPQEPLAASGLWSSFS